MPAVPTWHLIWPHLSAMWDGFNSVCFEDGVKTSCGSNWESFATHNLCKWLCLTPVVSVTPSGTQFWYDTPHPSHPRLHQTHLLPMLETGPTPRPVGPLVHSLRALKSSAEVSLMQEAGRITAQVRHCFFMLCCFTKWKVLKVPAPTSELTWILCLPGF